MPRSNCSYFRRQANEPGGSKNPPPYVVGYDYPYTLLTGGVGIFTVAADGRECRAGVDRERAGVDTRRMSTMAEIEAAIEQLPAAQVEALAVWLAAQRARRTQGAATGGGGTDALESLAGSWQEDPAFDAAVLAFEQVDEAMWR